MRSAVLPPGQRRRSRAQSHQLSELELGVKLVGRLERVGWSVGRK